MEQRIEKNGKATTHFNVKDRDRTRFGQTHEGRVSAGQNVEVIPGKSIRLFGVNANLVNGAQRYDHAFKVGDTAEYDSYNLHYFGEITGIGAKTVTIEAHGRKHRLNLHRFNFHNIEDIEKKRERNRNWTD